MVRNLIILFSLVGMVLFFSLIVNAEAITLTKTNSTLIKNIYNGKLIGIQLSQACITMEKNHIKSNCLSYATLKQFDNTDVRFYGEWINDTWYHRSTLHTHNIFKFDTGNWTVMVDPTYDYQFRAKMIYIQPDHFIWANPDETITKNHTRIEYNDRFMNGCTSAIVAPSLSLIKDTISYLENGCTKTSFDGKKVYTVKTNPWENNNKYSSLIYKNYVSSLFNGHYSNNGNKTNGGNGPGNCINFKCNQKSIYSNW